MQVHKAIVLLSLAAIVVWGTAAQDEPLKIGIVDVDEAITSTAEGKAARDELARDPIIWWNLASASAALFVLILAVNLVGDAVRDILDPRTLRENL